MNQYCYKCGQIITTGSRFCSYCGAQQQNTVPVGFIPKQHTKKSVLGMAAIITAAVVVVVCTASFFLFFAPQPTDDLSIASAETNQTWAEPTQKQAESADEAALVQSQTTISPFVQPSPLQTVETVTNQTITVNMDYDSGQGIYTGEVNSDGLPNGYGSFEMVSSDTGANWRYDGQWVSGLITGEGVMTQDDFIFTGSFKSGLMDGYCEIKDSGILRYAGMCTGGKLHGQGTLYTSSGMMLYEGEFQNDMLLENADARKARSEGFKSGCTGMDDLLYDACMAEDNTFGYPVAVWGFPLAMGDQNANGTIVIGHMGDDSYPVCVVYRYGVDEPKMTSDDWINAWGVADGIYEYVDSDGITVTCPKIEVVYWSNEQEGLS